MAAKLSESKLGKKFGAWFEKDFEKIQEGVEKWKEERARAAELIARIKSVAAVKRAQSYRDIEAYIKKYGEARDEARAEGNNRRAGGFQAKVTEGIGERETTKYIEQNDPDLQMDQGFKPGTGADQIYTRYDAEGNPTQMVVVEAKGPGAELSTDAQKGPQMSQQWMQNTIDDMVSSKDPAQRELGKRLQAAMDDHYPPITGKIVQALPGGSGAQEIPNPFGISVYNPEP